MHSVKFAFKNNRKKYDKVTKSSSEEPFTDYKEYRFKDDQLVTVQKGDVVRPGEIIAKGSFTNKVFYKNLGRLILLGLFLFISFLVYLAFRKRRREGRATL